MSAVCRHRGAVITEGEGRCKQFMCPYHNWTYALNGELIATPGLPPPMAGSKDFDLADHRLTAITTDFWAGFIFITFNPKPKPLMQSLGSLPEFLKNYQLDQMQFTHRDIYEVDCNWKIWLENAFENYHVPTIHRKHVDPSKPQNWQFEKTDGAWEAMYSERSIVAYSGLPALENLSQREAGGLFHIWLKPSVQIIITSSSMKYRQYLPEGPEKLRLIENWTFPKTTVERADFADDRRGRLLSQVLGDHPRGPADQPHRAKRHALGRLPAGPLFGRGIHRSPHRELRARSRDRPAAVLAQVRARRLLTEFAMRKATARQAPPFPKRIRSSCTSRTLAS